MLVFFYANISRKSVTKRVVVRFHSSLYVWVFHTLLLLGRILLEYSLFPEAKLPGVLFGQYWRLSMFLYTKVI